MLDNLDRLVVKPANESGGYGLLMGPMATHAERDAFARSIRANPRNYVAQPMISLSTAPTLTDSRVEARHLDLRPFILSGADTYVTTGGPHAGGDEEGLNGGQLVPRRRQQGHVGGGGGIVSVPAPSTPSGQARGSGGKMDILSRVAERVYWLGRYIERVESTARLVTVTSNLLMDLPVRLPLGWRPLIDITGSGRCSTRTLRRSQRTQRLPLPHQRHPRNPGSIIRSIEGVRENARTVRETMPRVTFEYFNDLYLFARSALTAGQSRSRRSEALEGISQRTRQLEGFLSQNMLHDAHWDMLRLGNYIERADMTTRIIDVRSADLFAGHHELEPFQHIQWFTVLRSFYAMQSYYASVREAVEPPLVLEFLFKDERLPRSYLRCLGGVQRSLRELPQSDEALEACDRAVDALQTADVQRLAGPENRAALHAFIDTCQRAVAAIHDVIVETYFRTASGRQQAAS